MLPAGCLFPARADLLQPGSRDELLALRQGVDTIPEPLPGSDSLRCGIEDFLGPDIDSVEVLGELLDDGELAFNLGSIALVVLLAGERAAALQNKGVKQDDSQVGMLQWAWVKDTPLLLRREIPGVRAWGCPPKPST